MIRVNRQARATTGSDADQIAAPGPTSRPGAIDFYCYGGNKALADLPMLAALGRPAAVNPNRALRKVAVRRGWPVLSFSDPVPLRAERMVGLAGCGGRDGHLVWPREPTQPVRIRGYHPVG